MAEWITVCRADEISEGEREVFDINGKWVAVFRISGKFYAIEDICPHDEGPLAEGELEGYEIECPRHGARFDVRDGAVKAPPALVNVPWYRVEVVDGDIRIEIL